jgi:pimeloyl-ACP methyl ester carboxylesterase
MNVVFVPGAGRDGIAAWPEQSAESLGVQARPVFLSSGEEGVTASDVLEALGEEGGHLVAHSAGAVPATVATASRPELVRSLVLFEPACFGLARGGEEVERHVREMSPVFADASAADVSDSDFATRFLTALGAKPPLPPAPALSAMGRRLRAVPPPWTQPSDVSFIAAVPTLVVTGGWNALYEEVATSLAHAGARHELLTGNEHRPQDHELACQLLRAHWSL